MSVKEDRFYTDIHRIALALERIARSIESLGDDGKAEVMKTVLNTSLEDDGK